MRVCRGFRAACSVLIFRGMTAWRGWFPYPVFFFFVGWEDLSICMYDLYKKKSFTLAVLLFPFLPFTLAWLPLTLGHFRKRLVDRVKEVYQIFVYFAC